MSSHISIIEIRSVAPSGDVMDCGHRFIGDLDPDNLGIELNGQFDVQFPLEDEIAELAGEEPAEEDSLLYCGLDGDIQPVLSGGTIDDEEEDPLRDEVEWGFLSPVEPATLEHQSRAHEGLDPRVHHS